MGLYFWGAAQPSVVPLKEIDHSKGYEERDEAEKLHSQLGSIQRCNTLIPVDSPAYALDTATAEHPSMLMPAPLLPP